jgi:hypothetical protein
VFHDVGSGVGAEVVVFANVNWARAVEQVLRATIKEMRFIMEVAMRIDAMKEGKDPRKLAASTLAVR